MLDLQIITENKRVVLNFFRQASASFSQSNHLWWFRCQRRCVLYTDINHSSLCLTAEALWAIKAHLLHHTIVTRFKSTFKPRPHDACLNVLKKLLCIQSKTSHHNYLKFEMCRFPANYYAFKFLFMCYYYNSAFSWKQLKSKSSRQVI